MAEIIDNKSRLLGDDIKQEMKSGAKVDIVASVFTIEKDKQLCCWIIPKSPKAVEQ